ncbi:YCF48-related protein [Sinimarinibacterium sp. NLF-5-8]|uniref:WD40/YVTN/BNR-like repeat-containing protein n=1 Tax=Sinimarinibacterium sp. NLF-5-8 TaxID=2698684 RepID=UPI00137B9953|nr:YCF48-related protein [Sinimarinibacterium sp. NLF-5-8]QHS11098.1 hypothetical protein GT972_13760 [Sinimarinibacterium sp. NLF-5-8]
MQLRLKRLGLLLCGTYVLAACNPVPDLDAAQAERAKPVQRFDTFLAVASNDLQRVSVAGGSTLVTSADAANTWKRQQFTAPTSIVGMSACPDGSFAALDFYRKVWMGDAQGQNWAAHALDTDFNPVAIDCDALNRLWVVGSYSTVLMSADKAASWQAQPPGEDAILTTVQFTDARHGFIGGEFGTLRVTDDGGVTWTQRPGLPDDFYPYALHFADSQHGWVTGLSGAILYTQDGGHHWTVQENQTQAPIYALVEVGAQLFGVGGGGQVLALRDRRWEPVGNAPRFESYLAAGAQLNAHSLLVAGAAGALQAVSVTAQMVRRDEVLP